MLDDDRNTEGTQASESLYTWWLNAIPALFGVDAAQQPGAADRPGDPQAAALPFGQAGEALEFARRLLTPLYQACLQALLAHPQPEQAFGAVLEQARTRLHDLSGTLEGFRDLMPGLQVLPWPGGRPMWDPWSAIGDAMKPMSVNLERAYGGLFDAFGLAPSRELQQAARELMASALARREAQAEYLAIAAAALARGVDGTFTRLREMGQRGESVDSVLGLVRIWARSTDEAVHAAMQANDALDASARLLRASSSARRQLQRLVGIVSATLNVPTRAEMDDAYREIQELKRELRRLRKASAQASVVPVVEADTPAVQKKAPRKRAPVAKTARSRKATV